MVPWEWLNYKTVNITPNFCFCKIFCILSILKKINVIFCLPNLSCNYYRLILINIIVPCIRLMVCVYTFSQHCIYTKFVKLKE